MVSGCCPFPVPDSQIRALIEVAERAPYGKGPDTLVDRAIRDCWQIGADRIRLAGAAWPDTFSRILDMAASGLGCPPDRLDAQLYKLLIYEKGGFFSAHRDTEKAGGMIATLSVALPSAGEGGELIVVHQEREFTIDMHVEEPSELAFAAFYADCVHETRPVLEGHRLSLVFNLCLRAGDEGTPRKPRTTPHRSARSRSASSRGSTAKMRRKVVWLLDHQYSEAGLSFDALKNADAARARNLALAAGPCRLRAVRGRRSHRGARRRDVRGQLCRRLGVERGQCRDMEMGEVYEGRYWLDGWLSRDGAAAPRRGRAAARRAAAPGALDAAQPDDQWLHEATGNEGVTLERAYRRAALAIWPRSRTLSIVASAGIDGAVAWVAEQLDRHAGTAGERILDLVSELIGRWPSERNDGDAPGRARMLALLRAVGDERHTVRFLQEVILHRYRGHENEELAAVMNAIGADAAKRFLRDLAAAQFPDVPRRPSRSCGASTRRMENPRRPPGKACCEKASGRSCSPYLPRWVPEPRVTQRQETLSARSGSATGPFAISSRWPGASG